VIVHSTATIASLIKGDGHGPMRPNKAYSTPEKLPVSLEVEGGIRPAGRSKSPRYGHLKIPHLMITGNATEQR